MKQRGMKAFLISFILWLIPVFAGGFVTAAFLSAHEYNMTANLAEAVQREGSLPEALKDAYRKEDEAGSSARAYLKRYGYRRLGRFTDNLPFTLMLNLVLFETAGCIVFFAEGKRKKKQAERITELTNYLKAADQGRAAVLMRKEDAFSHLEDEIYKTVAELYGTKEEAVKDHEILAARIADIAHQLKTPLTSMSLMTELLEPSQKEEQEYLERLKHQVERLKGLVDGLLALAKLDSHTLKLHMEAADMEDLLDAAKEPLQDMLDKRQVKLDVRPPESGQEIWINADMQWTSEAILNVLKNCAEHTPQGGVIRINYEQNPLYTELLIEDGGTGFSKKDMPHLFERFYRGERAGKDSAGIGLALTKLILEEQNGQIRAENSADGHARFCIRFYKK